MPFLIRYSTDASPGTTYTVLSLTPTPTEVEYPPKREYNTLTTQDHAVVIQRPIKDDRVRRWTWKNYPPTLNSYASLWTTLKTLEARARVLGSPSKNPIIQIWENVTDEGGFGDTTNGAAPDLSGYTNIKWTQVKFLQVHRVTRKGTGYVRYDDSYIEFVIADAAWESF